MLTLQSPGYFITAHDTDAGKTAASCWLIQQARNQGLTVSARKPIASGCQRTPHGLECEDTRKLAQALGYTESMDVITPWTFEPAISPEEACTEAGCALSLAQVVAACQSPATHALRIVEGAGGFLSPLLPGHLNRDLALALNLPVILVIRNQLGCINQALLTAEAITHAGLTLASILLNPFFDDHRLTENQQAIERYSGQTVHRLPRILF